MCKLNSDVNNTPNKILQGWKTLAEIDMGNTIEYDVKSYQVKTTVVKCTRVQLKGLKFNRLQKEVLVYPKNVWHNKTNLIKKLSRKRLQILIG